MQSSTNIHLPPPLHTLHRSSAVSYSGFQRSVPLPHPPESSNPFRAGSVAERCGSCAETRECSLQELQATLADIKASSCRIISALEREVEHLHHLFHTVSCAMGEGLILTDSTGRVSLANTSAALMLGVPIEKLHRSEVSRWFPQIDTYIRTADKGWEVHPENGVPMYIEVFAARVKPVTDIQNHQTLVRESGDCIIIMRPLASKGVFTTRSADLACSMLELPSTGYFFCTDSGGTSIAASPTMSDLTGYSEAELRAMRLHDLIVEQDAEIFLSHSRADQATALATALRSRSGLTSKIVIYRTPLKGVDKSLSGYAAAVFEMI